MPFAAPTPDAMDSSFRFTTPFTTTGHISGTSSNLAAAPLLFSVDVTGSGIASISGRIHDTGTDRFYDALFVDYRFAPSPAAATPEPATLVLRGTGLTVVMRWRRFGRTAA